MKTAEEIKALATKIVDDHLVHESVIGEEFYRLRKKYHCLKLSWVVSSRSEGLYSDLLALQKQLSYFPTEPVTETCFRTALQLSEEVRFLRARWKLRMDEDAPEFTP